MDKIISSHPYGHDKAVNTQLKSILEIKLKFIVEIFDGACVLPNWRLLVGTKI